MNRNWCAMFLFNGSDGCVCAHICVCLLGSGSLLCMYKYKMNISVVVAVFNLMVNDVELEKL